MSICSKDVRDIFLYMISIILYFLFSQDGSIIGAGTKVHSNKVTYAQWVQPAPSSGPVLVTTGADSKAVVWTVSDKEEEGLLVLHPKAILGI